MTRWHGWSGQAKLGKNATKNSKLPAPERAVPLHDRLDPSDGRNGSFDERTNSLLDGDRFLQLPNQCRAVRNDHDMADLTA